MKRAVKFYIAFLLLLTISIPAFAQPVNNTITDTTKQLPVQYRRGVELLKGYQTYEQKYAGKNLLEEKKRLYPLGFGTDHFGKITTGTGVWTELNPLVPRVDYLGIHFINPDTGWACGDLGTIIKTTDGGNGGSSWTVEQTNTTTNILKVNSFNGNVVVASGYSGLILRSSDGGETWAQETSGVTGDLWGLQMINDTLGWSCGSNNSLIKTTDGGLTWQTVTTPGYTGNYWWIDFMNKNYGFIAGDGKVLRTTKGGSGWDIIQAGDAQPLYSIDIIDSLHIAAAGYSGKMVYSEDAGETWTQHCVLCPLYLEIECIKFINPDTGYVVGFDGGLAKTTDRGNSWIALTLLDIGDYEIQFLPGINIGYSAGYSLKLYKAENNLDVWNKMIINDNLSDVYFTNEQKGFVISQYGNLYRTTNNGLHWDAVQGVPGGSCITFTDSLTGFYGSYTASAYAANPIYKTTDGGENWDSTNINVITGPVAKIFFINSTTGWAVTTYEPSVPESYILKTTDGGSHWFEQFSALISWPSFTSIYFVDSLYGWVSCVNRRPYKTTDGGENWIEQTNLNFYNTNDVYFTNIDTGWIRDGTYGFNKTTNGGVTWDNVGVPCSRFGFFPDKNHWWAYGASALYETTNNGSSWNEITRPSPMFGSFSAPLNWLGYGAGGDGFIVKYVDSSFIPVELTSFDAEVNKNKVILKWETATETNNNGFEVERSQKSDAGNPSWEKIGFVDGNGTTTQPHNYTFVDGGITQGTYKYRLKQIDFDGTFKYSKVIGVRLSPPLQFSLEQNYPNPFNPTTNINYTIPKETNVIIRLYDVTGREVKELVNEKKQPGEYTVKLKGDNLSSGVYFYRLTTSSGYTAVKKLILLK
jgi:photosystem II stability/assembly factor-like uncharacterized protein